MYHHKCELRTDSISQLPKEFPDSPWYFRLKRKLKKLCLVSVDHPFVFKYLKSNAAVKAESRRQVKESSKLIIHPLSKFRKHWDILIFHMMFIHQMLTAFAIGYFVDMERLTLESLMFIDIFVCFILLIEVIVQFRTGYIIIETNAIILKPNSIARKYLRTLAPDLICCIPFIYLTSWIIEERNASINGSTVILMCFLLAFNVYHFNRLLFYFSTIPIMLKLSKKGSIIMTLCLRSLFLWHWAACVRRLVPLYIVENPVDNEEWLMEKSISKFRFRRTRSEILDDFKYEGIENLILDDMKEIFSNYTIMNKYTRSMMITLKLALQSGYGTETSDSIYNMLMTTFIMFVGWIYSTYVLILISNIIMAASISENKFEEMSNELDAFCESKELSKELTQKIKIFHKCKFQKHYFNEKAIKQSTPLLLRKEILVHSCAHLVSKVPLFKDLPILVLENIISCLKLEIYFPNDVIIQADKTGDSMFFIAYGTAAIITSSGQRLGTIADGSHFGEIALLVKGQKRIASVVALEMCEVYKLSYRDFRKVIEPHSDLLLRMERTALERIKAFEVK